MKRTRGSFVRVALPCLLVGTLAHIVFAWTHAHHCPAPTRIDVERTTAGLADGPRRTESAAASDPLLVAQLVDAHVRCPSHDVCLVDPRLLQFILTDPDRTRQQGTLVPLIDGTGIVGMALHDVAPRGLFGALGLRDGDVITEVDGRPVEAPRECHAAFRSAAGRGHLDVRFLRDGQVTHRRIELTSRVG